MILMFIALIFYVNNKNKKINYFQFEFLFKELKISDIL